LELGIIAGVVIGIIVCVALIGRRWADREQTQRPEPNPPLAQPDVPTPHPGQVALDHRLSVEIPFADNPIYSLAFTPDGKRLVVAGSAYGQVRRDHPILRVCDVENGGVLASFQKPGELGRYTAVAISPDGKAAAAVGVVVVDGKPLGNICVWDLESQKPRWSANSPGRRVECVAWSPDGTRLAVGDLDGNIKAWDAAGGPAQATWAGYTGKDSFGVFYLVWSNDSKRIASREGGTIRVWDAADHRELTSIPVPKHFHSPIAYTPDDRSLYVCGRQTNDVWVWDFDTSREVRSLATHPTLVGGFALGPGGKSFVTVVNDTIERQLVARCWDATTGQELWAVAVPTDNFETVSLPFAISRDGKRLALADMERLDTENRWTVTLYNLPPPP